MKRNARPGSLRRRTALLLAASLISTTALVAFPAPLAAAAPRPNIVVFYIDDVNPHDGRLWNDPVRTPAIYETFIAHGIHFTNAFGEDPLCCPARASVLSGLHTHNNGVDINDGRLFSPQETVAGELKSAGYTTMWLGKYMNLNNKLSKADWAAHMAPWSVFDGVYGVNGAFYNYKVRTKDQGDIAYKDVHSTAMVTDRAVARFAAAPADKPIFAMLSVFDIHTPNKPMPITAEQSAMCDDMPPWWTPAYNEVDVSDKPAYIKKLPLLPYPDGWPMDAYCREMFGIDKMVERVTDELEAENRLDDTLLIFMGDNGMNWGAHRKGQEKTTPYSTAVPLYMVWPAGWGTAPRQINDYVTNIDFAPTFCELGGCALGPYPTGQSGPDGLSLVDLIGHGTPLGRDAILTSTLRGEAWRGIPGWAAVHTTPESSLGLWHYVELVTGERELYDQTADPYELNNLAGDPDHRAVEAAMADLLAGLLNEGRVTRPDVSIWNKKAHQYSGYFRWSSTPTVEQTLTVKAKPRKKFKFKVQLKNNELGTDSFKVRSIQTGATAVRVSWLRGGTNVTSQMLGNGVTISSLMPSQVSNLVLKVTVRRGFSRQSQATFEIHVESLSDASRDDHLTLILHR